MLKQAGLLALIFFKTTILTGCACALLLPDAGRGWLDGLPLTRFSEFLLLAFLAGSACLSKRFSPRPTKSIRILLAGLLVLFLALRLLAVLTGTERGFAVCHRALSPDPSLECESSWDAPRAGPEHTRREYKIDRQGDSWRLGFINTLRFDLYTDVPGNPLRSRLPRAVHWWGYPSLPASARAWVLEFCGQVVLRQGDLEEQARSYEEKPAKLRLAWELRGSPPGRFDLTYRYDDGSRVGRPPSGSAPPHLRLYWMDDTGSLHLYDTAEALQLGSRLDLNLASLIATLMWLAAGCAYLLAGWLRAWWILPGRLRTCLLGIFAAIAVLWFPIKIPYWPGFIENRLSIFLLAWLVLGLLWPENRDGKPGSGFGPWLVLGWGLAVLTQFNPMGSDLSRMVVYQPGHDWLTYEGYAFEILRHGNLRAGESVFHYQPFYRYWLAGLHIFFGDANVPLRMVEIFLLGALSILAPLRLYQSAVNRWVRHLAVAACLAIALIAGQLLIPASAMRGLSETLFCILFMAALWNWLRRGSLVWTAIWICLAAITRFNLLPASLVFMVVIVCLGHYPRQTLWRASLAGLAVLALPLAHNLYYGEAWVWLPTSGSHVSNLMIPPKSYMQWPWSEDVWRHLLLTWKGLSGLMVPYDKIPGRSPSVMVLALWLALLLASGAFGVAIIRRSWRPLAPLLPLLAAAGPFLFYESGNYYPRLVMPCALMAAGGLLLLLREVDQYADGANLVCRHLVVAGFLIWGLLIGQYFVLEDHKAFNLIFQAFQLGFAWLLWRSQREHPLPPSRLAWLPALFLLLSLGVFLLSPRTGMDLDLQPYWQAGQALLDQGRLLRHDYPFLANYCFAPAAALSSGLASFEFWFAMQSLGLWGLCLWLTRRMALQAGWRLLADLWPLAVAAPMLAWMASARYDPWPVAFCMVSLWAWWKRKHSWAVLAAVAGFWVKFFPALLLPPMFIGLAMGSKWRQFTRAAMVAAAGLALPFAFYSWPVLLKPFVFQGSRALTENSLWYQLYLAITPLAGFSGTPWEAAKTQGWLFSSSAMFLVLAAALLFWYLLGAWRMWVDRRDSTSWHSWALGHAAGAVLIFVAANRIYSEQFMLWVWPLAPLAAWPWREKLGIEVQGSLWAMLLSASALNTFFFALSGEAPSQYIALSKALFWSAYMVVLVLAMAPRLAFTKSPVSARKRLLLVIGGIIGLLCLADTTYQPILTGSAVVTLFTALFLYQAKWRHRLLVTILLLGALVISIFNLTQPMVWVEVAGHQPDPEHPRLITCCRYYRLPPGRVQALIQMEALGPLQRKTDVVVELVTDHGKRRLAYKSLVWQPADASKRLIKLEDSVLRTGTLLELRVKANDSGNFKLSGYKLIWAAQSMTLLEIMAVWLELGADNWLVFALAIAGLCLARFRRMAISN
jgi:hypothetical protein